MRTCLIFILLVITTSVIQAQSRVIQNLTTFDEEPVHFGFMVGVNTMDMKMKHWTPLSSNPIVEEGNNNWGNVVTRSDTVVVSDIADLVAGLSVGIVANIRLGRYFDLRLIPGLSFGETQISYNVPVVDENDAEGDTLDYLKIASTYIDFPVLFKYKAMRLGNQRPYIILGTSYRYNIASSGEEDLLNLRNGSFYLEAGIGLDNYLRFFKLSAELRVSLGLNDILGRRPNPDQQYTLYADAVKQIHSNIFTLCFYFE